MPPALNWQTLVVGVCAAAGCMACGSGSTESGASASSDPQAQATAAAAAPARPGEDWESWTLQAGEHRYRSSYSICCAKGEGRACCDGYDGPGSCHIHGGPWGGCVQEGNQADFKFHCTYCCEGLIRRAPDEPASMSRCRNAGSLGVFTCLRCGDGSCSTFENRCNCPEDCE